MASNISVPSPSPNQKSFELSRGEQCTIHQIKAGNKSIEKPLSQKELAELKAVVQEAFNENSKFANENSGEFRCIITLKPADKTSIAAGSIITKSSVTNTGSIFHIPTEKTKSIASALLNKPVSDQVIVVTVNVVPKKIETSTQGQAKIPKPTMPQPPKSPPPLVLQQERKVAAAQVTAQKLWASPKTQPESSQPVLLKEKTSPQKSVPPTNQTKKPIKKPPEIRKKIASLAEVDREKLSKKEKELAANEKNLLEAFSSKGIQRDKTAAITPQDIIAATNMQIRAISAYLGNLIMMQSELEAIREARNSVALDGVKSEVNKVFTQLKSYIKIIMNKLQVQVGRLEGTHGAEQQKVLKEITAQQKLLGEMITRINQAAPPPQTKRLRAEEELGEVLRSISGPDYDKLYQLQVKIMDSKKQLLAPENASDFGRRFQSIKSHFANLNAMKAELASMQRKKPNSAPLVSSKEAVKKAIVQFQQACKSFLEQIEKDKSMDRAIKREMQETLTMIVK